MGCLVSFWLRGRCYKRERWPVGGAVLWMDMQGTFLAEKAEYDFLCEGFAWQHLDDDSHIPLLSPHFIPICFINPTLFILAFKNHRKKHSHPAPNQIIKPQT